MGGAGGFGPGGTGYLMARWNVRARFSHVGALLAAIICAAAAPAAGEVRITDNGGGRLVIEVRDATVQQIVEALGESRPIQLRASQVVLPHVTGTYRGILPQVLSRILDGYDHVIRSTSSGIEIDVVGGARAANITGAVANTVTVSAIARSHAVSSNVDLDEENVRAKHPPVPLTANMLGAPPPNTTPISPSGATPAVNPQRSRAPHVSSNVDLDEETSR
jgi:hypothetical protein